MVKTQHRPGTPLDIVTAPAPPPWAAALVAVAGALAVWIVAVPGFGIELAAGSQQVGPGSIAVAAVVAVLAGWALRALLARHRNGQWIWTTLAATVLLLSFAAPVLTGASAGALVVLEVMHLVVGAAAITLLRGSKVRRARR